MVQLALSLLQHFLNFPVLHLFFLKLFKRLLIFLLLVLNQLFFPSFLEVKILEDTFELLGNILEEVLNIVGSLVVQKNSRTRSAASGTVGAPQPESGVVSDGRYWDEVEYIAAIIIFTVRGLTLSYKDFSYNGENGYVFSKRGLNGAYFAN